jgi:beta-glucanase (GH16 family)
LPAGSTGGNWILTFQDEFNGTSLDTSKWSSGYGWGDRTDWTQEWCKPANIVVSGGLLNLKVTKEDNNGKPYASACVNTKNKFYQERGYFEIRMKPIKGNGWLNAFWSKRNTEEWPPELDVIEVIGPNTNRPYHTIHYNCPGTTTPCNSGSPDMDKGDLSAAFHTYGAEWQDNQVIWYVDGVETWRTSNNANLINGAFYLMVNVHVGSGWMGYPDANQQYPVTMQVDYVRAWRR